MNAMTQLRAGAIVSGLAVALGAFGAHALHETLLARDHVATWDTAVHYQLAHGLALLVCAVLSGREHRCNLAAWCFLLGSTIFSGTLYLLAAIGPRWLGAITPIGGVLLLIGWGSLAFSEGRPGDQSDQFSR